MFYKQTNESWFIVSDDLACLHYIQSSTWLKIEGL